MHFSVMAQDDTSIIKKNNQEENHQKTFMGKMINTLKRDTTEIDLTNQIKRNVEDFRKYDGLIIRNIEIDRFPFGFTIGDTSRRFSNSLTKMANYLHHLTKINIIKKNLFFKKGEKLRPFLMADNERYLRQLLYLQDAEIKPVPITTGADSIDIIVEVKDVFSLGGSINSLGTKQTSLQFREDNFAGSGNAGIVNALYDANRKNNFAFGGEYDYRNISGSFIDGRIGYQSSYPTFTGPKEDNNYYLNLVKPLINRYMKWTYEFDAVYHSTRNLYTSDSIYYSDIRYRYYNFETWVGYNINWKDFTAKEESQKLRKLIGARFINNQFQIVPGIYKSDYNWQYANLYGILATLTFYRQNFIKTKYIYGFGRNEDIPEGLLMSFTTGYTIKQNSSRPFLGFNFQHYRFNKKENYLSYTFRAEGHLKHKTLEDINLLGSVLYFDHLKTIGTKWKQRLFLNFDLAQQINTVLNEPLLANSQFGMREYGYYRINSEPVGGALRATIKAESEFFSPWSLAAFKFAPFVFSNVSVFAPYHSDSRLLTSMGGGIRTRNESLIFGTIELKGFYFPQKNFSNKSFDFELSTNLIFKYNTQFVRKPDFIQVN
jgi:hypothetical protein